MTGNSDDRQSGIRQPQPHVVETVEEIRDLEDKLCVLAYYAVDGAGAEWQFFAYSSWGWLTPGSAGLARTAEEIVEYGPFTVLTPATLHEVTASEPTEAEVVWLDALSSECDKADADMRKWVRVPVKYVRAALRAARESQAKG